jgi:hypothetical protein
MELLNHIIIRDTQAYIERKPHLKAEMVARLYVDGDHSIEAVMAQYDLTAGEVHAALAYYYDNQAELDAAYKQVVAEIRANAATLTTLKTRLAARDQGGK